MNIQHHDPVQSVPFDLSRPVHVRFTKVAALCSAHPAIFDSDGTATYSDLLDLAHRYAHVISTRIPVGAPVALCMKTNRHLVAAMLGALMTGRPYLPLDPTFPADHLRRVMTQSGAKLVIGYTTQDLAALTGPESPAFDTVLSDQVSTAPTTFTETTDPDSAAFIIYTSGSTGAPKGVWQDQRGLLHDIMQYKHTVNPTCHDRQSLLYSPCVTGALRDIYGAILNGATLCMSDLRRDGLGKVLNDLTAWQVTILHAMPPVLRSLVRAANRPICPSARLYYTAGDRFLVEDLSVVRASLPDGCAVFTGIGSTECGTLYRHWIIPDDWTADSGQVPVGHAIDQRELRLVDEQGRDVPAGEIGQIRVSSPFIARGYWNNPDLSRRSFETDPNRPGWRSFQPGDLGRLRPDGLLEFLGRADRQIKIRGFRVEPAELESALRKVDGVAEAIALPHTTHKKTSLVVFVEPHDGKSLDGRGLKKHLQKTLPSQFHPDQVLVLDTLPRLGNYKFDVPGMRDMLKAPEPSQGQTGDLASYLSHWQHVLDRPVDPDMTLEQINADSLELLELELRLEKQLKVSVRGTLVPESTPRQIWQTAMPAGTQPTVQRSLIDTQLNALSALMAGAKGNPLDPDGLVRLYNPKGTRMPLIWCFTHANGGKMLAKALGPDQPVIAMRSMNWLLGKQQASVADERLVCDRYIDIILNHDLPQQVAVGGNCRGTWFASQIAHALTLAGHLPATMICLEKIQPLPYPGRSLLLFGQDSRSHNPKFRFANPSAAWGKYLPNARSLTIAGEHGKFFIPKNVGGLAQAIRDEIDLATPATWLPMSARQVSLSCHAIPGAHRRVSIKVTNPNQVPFEAGNLSHIALTIHALDQDYIDRRHADDLDTEVEPYPFQLPEITLPLPDRLLPGETISQELDLTSDPFGTATYLAGLCEEGIGWFTLTKGSDPLIRF